MKRSLKSQRFRQCSQISHQVCPISFTGRIKRLFTLVSTYFFPFRKINPFFIYPKSFPACLIYTSRKMDTQNQHKEHWLNLIIDRLTGTISEDSDLCLQEWIDASDENSQYFRNMEQLWDSMEVVREGEQYDSDRAFLLFQQRVRAESTINTRKSFTLKKVLSYAAILISFIVLNYLTYQYYIHSSDQNIIRLSEIAVPNGSKQN